MTAAEYKQLREKIGTQADVAKMLGVTRVTIARRETGDADIRPEAEIALRFCRSAKQKGVK